MSGRLEGVLALPPTVAYLVIAVLVFGEAAIFLGFVLPGETAVVLGGVLASRGTLHLLTLTGLVVAAAVVGDSVGYEVGRRSGPRVLSWQPLRRHATRLDGVQLWLRHRGGYAVFLGRWTAFLRAVTPGLAGVSRMPYPRFLAYNVLGGLAWGVTFCLVGYLAGNSYQQVERMIGRTGAAATGTVLVAAVLVWARRRHVRSRHP